MKGEKRAPWWRDPLLFTAILALTVLVTHLLSKIFNDNNPFAVPMFILAVALISRVTSGYFWGIAASVLGVFFVNYIFSYPFWEFNLSVTGYPLNFAVMLIVSVIISTLTTQVKKQEELRFEAEKEKMRADLLRSVSHDLRTPLASIMGACSTLRENRELPAADRDDLLREIGRDADWLQRVMENILSVTRFSGGGVALRKTDEVVEEIVGSAIVKFRKSRSKLPISVEKPEEILLAPMDATLIEQVLLNLLENVAVHARTATRIRIRIASESGRVRVEVSDDGVGVNPALLPHVFDGYSSLSDQGSPDGRRNMGIGLSVCRSIIRAHGGEMSAANNRDGGATFGFWLPLEEKANEQ
jgi:two-component system sensor histidine kinase KdpD